ncbi:GyrI-like domain-containing protein [Mesobacillus maritimus]|uniref:AraC family transcriptional regulator n=1 Tax=Mesobacillus maritimus TaxID=1643336 RepID=A0ABS7KBT1_9BACI|nr:GyrI-like domain-containing protein [Mesobacillus maritimus]MBY0099511.1 AraC family transcriptional regulator [Mesobacillus maritimus]
MKYHVIERNAFQVVGLKKVFQCDGEVGPSSEIQQLWGEVSQDGTIDQLMPLVSGEITGLIGMTVDYSNERNELEYWIAVEGKGNITEHFSTFDVPAAKWVVFDVVGPYASAIPATWRKIYSEWFPFNDFVHSGGPSLEVHKSHDPNCRNAQSEIWVPVK